MTSSSSNSNPAPLLVVTTAEESADTSSSETDGNNDGASTSSSVEQDSRYQPLSKNTNNFSITSNSSEDTANSSLLSSTSTLGKGIKKMYSIDEDWNLPLAFNKSRHNVTIEGINSITQTWRMKERMKTVSVALVLCLNVGVDPPDIVKTQPCAQLECWIDPLSMSPQKALETIGLIYYYNGC